MTNIPTNRRTCCRMLIAGVCGLVQTACRQLAITLPPEEPAAAAPSASPPDIDVYVDASTPIRGFLAEAPRGERNHFIDLIHRFDGILSGSRGNAVRYWSFGKGRPRPVKSVLAFLRENTYSERETFIDEAIRHDPEHKNPKDRLKIIVTDLFQTDTDVNKLANLLNENFIKDPSRGVGLIAVRNPFSGPIDDLPGHLPSGAADSLPFYILVMGGVREVARCIQEIRDGSLPSDAKNRHLALLFSRTQTKRLDRKLIPASITPSHPGYTLEPSRVPGAEARGIPFFVARREFTVGFVKFDPLLLLVDGPQLLPPSGDTTKVTAWEFPPGQVPGLRKLSPEAAGAVTVSLSEQTLTVARQQLAAHSAWLFRLDLFAARPDFAQFSPWCLDINDTARILRQAAFDPGPDGKRPGKTPNLDNFLRTMSARMFESEIPLARYHFFVGPA